MAVTNPYASHRHARVLKPRPFTERLSDELARCERYRRTFTLILLQAPSDASPASKVWNLNWVLTLAQRQVRSCDLIGMFAEHGLLAMLLPETGEDGARAVLGRLRSKLSLLDNSWVARLATFPKNQEIITYFLARAEQSLEEADA